MTPDGANPAGMYLVGSAASAVWAFDLSIGFADLFHVHCALTLQRLYCFFVIEVGSRYAHSQRDREPGRPMDHQQIPRANSYAERFVLTARTEATDRMLILGQRHLRTILAQHEATTNGRRPHRSRQLRPPRPDHPVADLSQERIQRRPILDGVLNECERAA